MWQPQQAAVFFHIARFDGPDGLAGPGLAQIERLAWQYDLIVIDTLVATLSGGINENDNTRMGVIINELARIAHTTETAVVLVHHTGKNAGGDDIFNTLRGASAIRGGYDVGLLLDRKPDESEAVLHAESRDVDVENMTIRQSAHGAGWEYVGSSFEIEKIRAGKQTLQAMLEMDSDHAGLTVKEIATFRKVSETTTYKQLERLEEGGYVLREEQPSTQMGKKADIWYVAANYR
jgi:RecA-family ATPase